MKELAAIRDALKAGPTPGPWIGAGPSFGDPLPRYITEIVRDRDDGEECEETICDFPVAALEPENEANALLISACNPAAMTAVLAYVDALQAENQALRADARPGWLPIATAPKDRAILLLAPTTFNKWTRVLPLPGRWFGSYFASYNADEAIQRVEPTHWMPLPTAPTIDAAVSATGEGGQ